MCPKGAGGTVTRPWLGLGMLHWNQFFFPPPFSAHFSVGTSSCSPSLQGPPPTPLPPTLCHQLALPGFMHAKEAGELYFAGK